jgi:hypothetical protein
MSIVKVLPKDSSSLYILLPYFNIAIVFFIHGFGRIKIQFYSLNSKMNDLLSKD